MVWTYRSNLNSAARDMLQAFLEMGKQSLDMVITMIALQAYKHNVKARTLNEKLGFAGDNANMVKILKKKS